MTYLEWIAEHPVLTVVLVIVGGDALAGWLAVCAPCYGSSMTKDEEIVNLKERLVNVHRARQKAEVECVQLIAWLDAAGYVLDTKSPGDCE